MSNRSAGALTPLDLIAIDHWVLSFRLTLALTICLVGMIAVLALLMVVHLLRTGELVDLLTVWRPLLMPLALFCFGTALGGAAQGAASGTGSGAWLLSSLPLQLAALVTLPAGLAFALQAAL